MEQVRSPPVRRFPASRVGLLAVAGMAVFAPVVGYAFAYDDHWTIETNAALGWKLSSLVRALADGTAAHRGVPDSTRPTMVLSMWLDRRLFGADPAGYHLHSLLLYGVTVVAATLCLFALTRRAAAALSGGAWFAVMPVHAEVVAAVNYREDLYSAISIFGLLSCLFWPRRRADTGKTAALVAALFAIGLLAKESTVTLALLVAFVAAVGTHGPRLRWAGARRRSLAAAGGVLAAYLAARLWLRATGRDDVPLALESRGAVERTLRTGRYVLRAAFDSLVPLHSAPDYPKEPVPSVLPLVGALALVAVVVLLARRRRSRPLALGIGITIIAPLATSPLVSPINEFADRYLFVASLGGALVAGLGLAWAGERLPSRVRVPLLVALLLLVAVPARRAAALWKNDSALWAGAVERAPTSARAWTGYARDLRLHGDLDAADRAIEHAITLDPHLLTARVVRLYNHLARGDTARAKLDIEEIRSLGGAHQRGMRLAERCSALSPDAAKACASPGRAPDPSKAGGEPPGPRPAGP